MNRVSGRVRIPMQFIAICLVAGSGSYLTAVALTGFGFTQVAWARALLGSCVLIGVALVQRRLVLPRSLVLWWHLLVLAASNLLAPYLLLAWGLQYIPSSVGAVLNATVPLLSLLLSVAVFRTDRASALSVTALVVGLLGVVLVLQPWRAESGDGRLIGAIACLGSAACFAFSFAYTRRFIPPERLAGLELAALTAGIGAGYFLLLTPVLTPGPVRWDSAAIIGLVLLGIFGSAFGLLWSLNVLRAWGPIGASLPMYAAPVIGMGLGVGFLGEALSAVQVLGAVLTIAALVLAAPRRSG